MYNCIFLIAWGTLFTPYKKIKTSSTKKNGKTKTKKKTQVVKYFKKEKQILTNPSGAEKMSSYEEQPPISSLLYFVLLIQSCNYSLPEPWFYDSIQRKCLRNPESQASLEVWWVMFGTRLTYIWGIWINVWIYCFSSIHLSFWLRWLSKLEWNLYHYHGYGNYA